MNLVSILILALIAVGFFAAVKYSRKKGCSCGQHSCRGCTLKCRMPSSRSALCGYFYRIQEAHAAQIPDRKAVQPGGVTAEKLQTTGSKYTELITSPRSYGHSRRRRI